MIKYRLRCDQDHHFDSWFRAADDFTAQQKKGLLACPQCGSTTITKALMSPKLPRKRNQISTHLPVPAQNNDTIPMQQGAPDLSQVPAELREKVVGALREMRDAVVASTRDVGDKFAEEARAMHFGEKEQTLIRGQASAEEVKDLVEDGVPCAPLPVLPEDHN